MLPKIIKMILPSLFVYFLTIFMFDYCNKNLYGYYIKICYKNDDRLCIRKYSYLFFTFESNGFSALKLQDLSEYYFFTDFNFVYNT
jgi:hypothetical protein